MRRRHSQEAFGGVTVDEDLQPVREIVSRRGTDRSALISILQRTSLSIVDHFDCAQRTPFCGLIRVCFSAAILL